MIIDFGNYAMGYGQIHYIYKNTITSNAVIVLYSEYNGEGNAYTKKELETEMPYIEAVAAFSNAQKESAKNRTSSRLFEEN